MEEYATQELLERQLLIAAFRHHNSALSYTEAYMIAYAVRENADKTGLSVSLIAGVIITESHARWNAVSEKGAIGLMQVMPPTAKNTPHPCPLPQGERAIKQALLVIDTNVCVGTHILADNIERWGYGEGIQRYFWGSGVVPHDEYLAKVLNAMEGIDG